MTLIAHTLPRCRAKFRSLARTGLFCLALLATGTVTAQGVTSPAGAAATTVDATAITGAAVATAPASFDPVAATKAYLARLQGPERARSDAYTEGGYWLPLWDLLYGLALAWLLLSRRVSLRLREFAERRSRHPNRQTAIYVLAYVPLVSVLTFPLTWYEGFYREHQYGLSNLSFAGWLGEQGIGLALNTLAGVVALVGLYALVRRAGRTWWAWGTLAGTAFLIVGVMISPVFIAPLFNTYQPVPEGPVREAIASLARANGIPADNVYYFDASKQTRRISANVSGLFGTTRIALNDNLLKRTSLPEIRAVMAHEMGHYVLDHGLKLTLAFSLLLLGGLLFITRTWRFAQARFGSRFGVRDLADPAGLPQLLALFSVAMFLAQPLVNTLVRSAETEADMYGLNASREPDGFAEAIFQLAEYRKLQPGPVEEFLFYDHPAGATRIANAMRWKAENLK